MINQLNEVGILAFNPQKMLELIERYTEVCSPATSSADCTSYQKPSTFLIASLCLMIT